MNPTALVARVKTLRKLRDDKRQRIKEKAVDSAQSVEWWQRPRVAGDVDWFLECYDALDSLLVSKGFPPTSPWWRAQIERFMRSGRKTFVLRVGRRGGKSSTLSRYLVVLALAWNWPIPPGDIGVIPIVSVDSGEAASRLVTIRAILDAIGAPYGIYSNATSQGWKFLDRPIQFRVKACSIAGTSGFTGIGIFADEASKWRSPSDGANPAKEIITSLKATTATQKEARIIVCSSAFSTADEHAKMIDAGDSEEQDQLVAIAATWETNPTVTEEETRKLEPDRLKWLREYGSIPSDAGNNPWFITEDVDLIERCLWRNESGIRKAVACIDTGFRRNASGLVIVGITDENKFAILDVFKIVPQKGQPLRPSAVLAEFAERMRANGVTVVASDQHYIETAREYLDTEFQVVELPGGAPGKVAVYTAARDAMREGNVSICQEETGLIRELRRVSYKLSSGGSITITSPTINGEHGDVASAFTGAIWLAIDQLASMVDVSGDLEFVRNSVQSFSNRQRGF